MTTYVHLDSPYAWPSYMSNLQQPSMGGSQGLTYGSGSPMDATNEGLAVCGYMKWADGDVSAKTISSSGGLIGWRLANTLTWSDGSTVVRVGLQTVTLASNYGPLPTDTWGAYADCDPSTDSGDLPRSCW